MITVGDVNDILWNVLQVNVLFCNYTEKPEILLHPSAISQVLQIMFGCGNS